jgi:hypothetical protein
VRGVRDLHARRAELRLAALTADLHDVLCTSAALRAESAASGWIGVARRDYRPVEGLRLFGLFCEPVVSADGYAGVVTWLCDASGRLYRLGDVRPGEPSRAVAAYTAAADFGGVTAPHQRLARTGLLVQRSTVSADGRLGGGRDVQAVLASPCAWTDAAPAARWAEPLAAQLDRAFAALDEPEEERPGGADLVFVDGVVLGASGDAVALQAGGVVVRATAVSVHAELRYRANLARLAAAPGLRVRAVLRLDPDRPRTGALLAFGPLDDALRPPAPWGGRVCAGLDALQGAHLPAPVSAVLADDEAAPDPTEPLRRRLRQVALGGRAALPPDAGPEIAREAARLERRLLPTGAALLRALAVAAVRADRGLWGTRERPDPEPLARAWSHAATWERAAVRHLHRRAWDAEPLDPPPAVVAQ